MLSCLFDVFTVDKPIQRDAGDNDTDPLTPTNTLDTPDVIPVAGPEQSTGNLSRFCDCKHYVK